MVNSSHPSDKSDSPYLLPVKSRLDKEVDLGKHVFLGRLLAKYFVECEHVCGSGRLLCTRHNELHAAAVRAAFVQHGPEAVALRRSGGPQPAEDPDVAFNLEDGVVKLAPVSLMGVHLWKGSAASMSVGGRRV